MRFLYYSETRYQRKRSPDHSWVAGLIMIAAVAYGAIQAGWGGAALAFLGCAFLYAAFQGA